MRIAIVGAGIGGLTLAAALRQRATSADVEVFERDDSAFSRSQGYAIGLKYQTGLRVLGELGLRDATLATGASPIGRFVFTNQRGRELLSLAAGSDEARITYRVQRRQLRQTLLDVLDGTPVHFGRRCVGYATTGSGAVLPFEDGSSVDADLVAACDGVGSSVRAQMADADKHYLGLTAIYGHAQIAPKHPLLAGGYFMSLGNDGSSIFCYAQPGGTTHFSYTMHAGSEAEVGGQDNDWLLDRVREATSGWHPLVAAILGSARTETIGVRGYYDRLPPRTITDGPVWLLGDAAHAMSPFQGQGGNTAMLDALDLANLLASGYPPADRAVGQADSRPGPQDGAGVAPRRRPVPCHQPLQAAQPQRRLPDGQRGSQAVQPPVAKAR
jgi:salicylate hydroxylase